MHKRTVSHVLRLSPKQLHCTQKTYQYPRYFLERISLLMKQAHHDDVHQLFVLGMRSGSSTRMQRCCMLVAPTAPQQHCTLDSPGLHALLQRCESLSRPVQLGQQTGLYLQGSQGDTGDKGQAKHFWQLAW